MLKKYYFLLLGFSVLISLETFAVGQAGPLPITRIRTGWNGDTFAIETNQTIVNPAKCTYPDAYMSSATEPGYKTYLAATMTAFSMNKPVTIIVSDTECVASRPKIWGVYIAQ